MNGRRRLDRRGRKRTLWIVIAVPLLGLVLAGAIWTEAQLKQDALDSALIQAIKLSQTDRTVLLLNQGANANALDRQSGPWTIGMFVSEIRAKLYPTGQQYAPPRPALLVTCEYRDYTPL